MDIRNILLGIMAYIRRTNHPLAEETEAEIIANVIKDLAQIKIALENTDLTKL